MNLEQLIDQFELVTETEEGIRSLRKLITKLALDGILTVRKDQDEPVEELLKRIDRERKSLYEDGIIRKPKKLKIDDENIEKSIPDAWKMVKLGNLIDFFKGKRPSTLYDEMKDNRVPYLNNKFLRNDNLLNVTDPDDPKAKFVDDTGLIIVWDGSRSGEVFYSRKGALSSTTAFIRIFEVSREFLYHFLNTKFEDYNNNTTGAAIPHLNRKIFENTLIALPPLEEQQRIVQKIETLFTQVDALEQKVHQDRKIDERLQAAVLDDLQRAATPEASRQSWQRLTDHFEQIYRKPEHIDQLKQAILNEAVRGRLVPQDPSDEPAEQLLERIKEEKQRLYEEGEIRKPKDLDPVSEDEIPYEIPKNWKWVKFNEMANFINGDRGKNYPNKREYVDDGIPWINTGHITKEGTLTTEGMNYITREKYNSLRSGKIKEGDLVYCLRGATFGKTAFVEPYKEGAIASSLMIIRTYFLSMNKYIFHYLLSPLGRNQLFRFDNGSAQPNLSASSVKKYAFPLPPLEEQKRIVNKINELFTWCDDLKSTLNRSQQTDQRLLEALVNGQNK